MFSKEEKVCFRFLNILKSHTRLSRRQACQAGAICGLAFLALRPLKARGALAKREKPYKAGEKAMNLTQPVLDGSISLEKAIEQRRTIRSFGHEPIAIQQLSQILWAAQGITGLRGFGRAAPSAGALYPLDVYAVIGKNSIKDLDSGVYHYNPRGHSIRKIADGDRRKDVALASLRQMWMAKAPVLFVITAEYDRITIKYGNRGVRYAHMEVGHVGQNIFLQCQTLGLSAGIVGAFHDRDVAKIVRVNKDYEPLIIMPVGWQA